MLQPQYRVDINLQDIEFKTLYNAIILYYYYHDDRVEFLHHFAIGNSSLKIKNITAYNNSGNSLTDMLVIKFSIAT